MKTIIRTLIILIFIITLSCVSLLCCRAYGADTWTFAIIGDTRGDPTNPPDNGVSTNLSAIADKMASLGPKAVFANGDLIDGDDLPSVAYNTQFANWKTAMNQVITVDKIPVYTVRGNHENEVTDFLPPSETLKTAYYNAFGSTTPTVGSLVPQNGPNDANSNGNQAGFTWNLGSQNTLNQKWVRVIGVDQYFYYNSTAQGTSHYYQIDQTWLNQQFTKTAPTRYTFVMAHEPAYYLDSGGDNPEGDFYGTTNPNGTTNPAGVAARKAFWNSLGANGVKMYIACHVHNLQIGTAQDSNIPPNTIYQNVGGNGGAPLAKKGTVDPNLTMTYQNFSDYGFALYTVAFDKITIDFYTNPNPSNAGSWNISYSMQIDANPVYTWTGGGIGTNWATAGNWDVNATDAPINTGDTAVFNSAPGNTSTVTFAKDANIANTELFVASNPVVFGPATAGDAFTYTATSTAIDGSADTTYRPSLEIKGSGLFNTTTLTMDGVSSFIVDPGASATCGAITIEGGTPNITESGNINFTTLDVGTNNLTVTGQYKQPAGSTLKLTANSSSSFGKITSDTAADVKTGSAINVTVNNYIPNGATLNIIDTGGRGIGNIPATITSSNQYLTFFGSSSGGNLVLTANRSGSNSFSGAGATTNSNAATVGAVLDNVTNPSADMTTVLNTLGNSSPSQVASSLNSMTPTADGALLQAATSMANQFNNAVTSHLENIQPDITGVSTGDDRPIDPNIWAQGLGDYAHQDPRGSSNGYNATSWGVAGGADMTYRNDSLHMGIASGYGQTFVRSKDSSGRTDIDSIPGTLYFNYENTNHPFYLDAAFTFIYNIYKGSRQVTAGTTIQRTANADYKGQQYSTYFEGGYSFFYKNLRMTPLASFQYMHLHTGSYTETGADALNLSVNSQDYDMAMTGFGAKVAYPLEFKYGAIMPDLHAKWLYDWVGDNQATTASFAGGGTAFGTNGFRAARSGYDIGTKISLKTKYNISLDLDYDFFLKAEYYEHYGSVTLKYSF
jgi:uncharacterized protein with beta-barrel porin domain